MGYTGNKSLIAPPEPVGSGLWNGFFRVGAESDFGEGGGGGQLIMRTRSPCGESQAKPRPQCWP